MANGMIANYWGNSRVEDLEHFLGHPHPSRRVRERSSTTTKSTVRATSPICPFSTWSKLITPFYIGSVGTAHQALYPDNATVLRQVHEQGGIGGYVHPFGLNHRDPDAAGPGSERPSFPSTPFSESRTSSTWPAYGATSSGRREVWYRLLNTGSRIPATAGTDAMTDIWRHPAVGTTRSYVYTGEEELDYDELGRSDGGRAARS